MSAMRLAILCVALAAAGATAFLVHRMTSSSGPAVVQTAPAEARVLVAAHDVEIGSRLTPGDVKWASWPVSALNASFITQDHAPEAANEIGDAVTRTPLVAGEPLVEAKLMRAGDGGFLAARLRAGMRALSIKISAETGAGGFILPNDSVDVILTRKVDDVTPGSEQFRSETILRDVRVLAIDQNYEQVEGKQVFVGKTATLELSPVQAEAVALAASAGELQLALRAMADPNQSVAEEPEFGRRQRGGVTVVRYGFPSQVAVGASTR
ncbi:MAG: Flp pilus assembly protein CpaB [Alphaproteobacteria bacterium]|nr:Flp pilus assembly protein CpaB [Alphaproteobacteria bacterium]